MLKIRLRRTGKRNQPHYRVVVAEHTAPIKGKFVAILGHYNPRSKELVLKTEDVLGWMDKGAQPSNTVARLLDKHGMKHKQIQIHTFAKRGPKKPVEEVAEKPAKTEEPATEADKTAEDVAETPATETPEAAEPAKEEPTESKEEPVVEAPKTEETAK